MREVWTDMDELGYQMGDMNGEWKRPLKRWQKKSVPVILKKVQEKEKKHIKKTGKK